MAILFIINYVKNEKGQNLKVGKYGENVIEITKYNDGTNINSYLEKRIIMPNADERCKKIIEILNSLDYNKDDLTLGITYYEIKLGNGVAYYIKQGNFVAKGKYEANISKENFNQLEQMIQGIFMNID